VTKIDRGTKQIIEMGIEEERTSEFTQSKKMVILK